jgi:sensor histidine kinase regulating citrate/malate metabolism
MSRVYDALRRATVGEAVKSPKSEAESAVVDQPASDRILKRRITLTFAGLFVVVGLLILIAVYYFTSRTLRAQADQRASSVATTLSDAAASHLMARNVLELYALVRKYTRLEGVAYAFIADNKGDIAAHTLGTFPAELREGLGPDPRHTDRREVTLEGNKIYEVRVPIFEGQLGAAHLGIWEETVREQMRDALLPLFGVLTIVLLVGVLLSILLARRVSQLI